MTQFLRSGQFDPTPVITHRFPLERFDEAMRAIKSGERGQGHLRDLLTSRSAAPCIR